MLSCFVGIDVSKAILDVALWPERTVFQVSNDTTGHMALIARLSDLKVERILLEATGGYEKRVLYSLLQAGLPAVCINPVRARQYARAVGLKAKTDKIDALLLGQFAGQLDMQTPPAPSEERRALDELVKLRDAFVQQRDDNKRRRLQATLPVAIESYEQSIGYLQDQIKRVEKLINQAALALNRPLAEQLMAVKGLGPVTVANLMAYLPELGQMGRRQVAAMVGVAPYNNDSGKHTGKRQIHGGRGKLRRVLYMCAWVMVRFNDDFKARYEVLRASGKVAKVALVACMRMLIVRLNAMVRDGTAWNANVTTEGTTA